MVERFKAAVLKTAGAQASGSSNPSLSAIFIYHYKNQGVAMGFHKAPDTNLIQEGVEVSKKRNEKYLKEDVKEIP